MVNEAEIDPEAHGKRWRLMAVFGTLVVLFVAMAVSSKASTRLSLFRQTPCRCAKVNSQPLCACHFSFLLLFGYWENEGKYAGRNGNVWLLLFYVVFSHCSCPCICVSILWTSFVILPHFCCVFGFEMGKIRIGFDSNFSSLGFCTVNWVFGFYNLCFNSSN